MKGVIIFLLVSFSVLQGNAIDSMSSSVIPTENSATYSPEVCQFSLTSYSGTIQSGSTGSFRVGLSCPQSSDVRATVVVFINGEPIASKVVTVQAGKDYSIAVRIDVGYSYNGERYQLAVQ